MPRLYKKEKLCSATAIETLFGHGGADFTHLSYPVRAVARINAQRHSDAPIAFLISVPKKRLHHAVDRVTMRRRIREAYRLNRDSISLREGIRIDLAFVYVADKLRDYPAVDGAMKRILLALQQYFDEASDI